MPFDLVVAISMHFYEWCQIKRDEKNGDFSSLVRGVCLFFPQGEGGGRGTLIFSYSFFSQKTEYFFFGGGV